MLPVVDQWSTTVLYSGESEIRKVHILDTSLLVQSLCIKIREAISSDAQGQKATEQASEKSGKKKSYEKEAARGVGF